MYANTFILTCQVPHKTFKLTDVGEGMQKIQKTHDKVFRIYKYVVSTYRYDTSIDCPSIVFIHVLFGISFPYICKYRYKYVANS